MVLGFFFVRPIPLPDKASSQPLGDGDVVRDANHSSTTPLINGLKDRHPHYTRTDIDTPGPGEYSNSAGANDTEVAYPNQISGTKTTLDVHGKALFYSLDFWLLFSIYAMRMYLFLLKLYSPSDQRLTITMAVTGTGYTCMSSS